MFVPVKKEKKTKKFYNLGQLREIYSTLITITLIILTRIFLIADDERRTILLNTLHCTYNFPFKKWNNLLLPS